MEAPPAHRNTPSEYSGVPVGLFGSGSAPRCLLRNARPSGSLRSPSACAPKCSFGTFRCSGRLFRFRQRTALSPPKRSCFRFASLALRWVGEAPLPPCSAPKCSFGTFRCSGRLFFEKAMLWPFLQNARPPGSLRSPSVCAPSRLAARWCSGRLIGCAKRSTFRFASLTLRLRTEPALQAAPVRAMDFPSALHIPRRLDPSCARRSDRRQNVQHPLAPQHPCRPPASSFFLTARSSFRTSRRP